MKKSIAILLLLLASICHAEYPLEPTTGLRLDTNNLGGVNLGYYAGIHDPTLDSILIGFASNGAGNHNATSVQIGRHSGYDARNADNSVIVGHASSQYARNASQAVSIGYLAARNDTSNPANLSFCSVAIGTNAATSAIQIQCSVIIGNSASAQAQSTIGSVVLGTGTGRNAVNADGAVLIGQYAGGNAASLTNCIYLGNQTGYLYSRSNTLLIEGNPVFGQPGIGCLIYGEFDTRLIQFGALKMGFFGTPAITKPTITGSRSDGTALTNLLQSLQNLGLLNDTTAP